MVEKQIHKVLGYCRVSTEEQLDNTSLEDQRKRIEAYAISQGWILAQVFTEQGSGSTIDGRPLYGQMINFAIANNIDAIVVLKADRIHRNLKNLLIMVQDNLEPNEIAFVSVSERFDTSTAQGMLFLQMLGSFAEFERNQINARTKGGRLATAQAGQYAGGEPPYGYMVVNGKLVVNPETSRVVLRMFRAAATGDSLQEVADSLNKDGILTKHGKEWSRQSVSYVIKNPTYLGVLHYDGDKEQNAIEVDGRHDALVSKVLYGKVQAQLSRRNTRRKL